MADSVQVDLQLRDKLTAGMKRAQAHVKSWGSATARAMARARDSIMRFGRAANKVLDKYRWHLRAATAAAGATIGLILRATATQGAAEAKLSAVLRATGNAAGYTAEQLKAMAREMQAVTTYGDELIINAMGVMATFTQIKGDTFRDAMKAALDLSAAFDQDLKASVIMMGKALNDPVRGMTALTRTGVSFSAAQKEMVRRLQESGDLMGAQKVILDELAYEMGGAASAAAATFGGQLKQLKNAAGDLAEQFGGAIVPVVQEFARVLKGVVAWVSSWDDTTKRVVATTGLVVAGLLAFATAGGVIINAILAIAKAYKALVATQIVSAALANPAALLVGLAAAAGAVYLVSKAFGSMADEARKAAKAAADAADAAGGGTSPGGGDRWKHYSDEELRRRMDRNQTGTHGIDWADRMGLGETERIVGLKREQESIEAELARRAEQAKTREEERRAATEKVTGEFWQQVEAMKEQAKWTGKTQAEQARAAAEKKLRDAGVTGTDLELSMQAYDAAQKELETRQKQVAVEERLKQLKEEAAQAGLDALQLLEREMRAMGASESQITQARSAYWDKRMKERKPDKSVDPFGIGANHADVIGDFAFRNTTVDKAAAARETVARRSVEGMDALQSRIQNAALNRNDPAERAVKVAEEGNVIQAKVQEGVFEVGKQMAKSTELLFTLPDRLGQFLGMKE